MNKTDAKFSMHYEMAYSLCKTRLQGIMVVEFIETIIQSKMMNTTTMIPSYLVSLFQNESCCKTFHKKMSLINCP